MTKIISSSHPGRRRARYLNSSVAVLCLAAIVGGPVAFQALNGSYWTSPAWGAERVMPQGAASRPVGFSDVVARVKPAVISVRVKIDEAEQSEDQDQEGPVIPSASQTSRRSHLKKFFGDVVAPEKPDAAEVAVGEGSGFFISADGYAVTNNHVVEHPQSVEVTTNTGRPTTPRSWDWTPRPTSP